MKKIVTRVLLPLIVVGVAVVGARGLMALGTKAERTAAATQTPLVEAVRVSPQTVAAQLTGFGVVLPEREVVVSFELLRVRFDCHTMLLFGPCEIALTHVEVAEVRARIGVHRMDVERILIIHARTHDVSPLLGDQAQAVVRDVVASVDG